LLRLHAVTIPVDRPQIVQIIRSAFCQWANVIHLVRHEGYQTLLASLALTQIPIARHH